MSVFRVQVFYQRGVSDKWTNVYHVDAADIGVATDAAVDVLRPALLPLLDDSCAIVKLLVSDPASADFVEQVSSAAGTSSASGSILPLFNSVKVFFRAGLIGRPDYKFLKGAITESVQTDGLLESTFVTAVDNAFTDLIGDMSTASAPLCSESGDLWTTVDVQEAVQGRQMHRKRKRPATP